MGLLGDAIREIPHSIMLQDKLALSEAENNKLKARNQALEKEVELLRHAAKIAAQREFIESETERVLNHLFGKAIEYGHTVPNISMALDLEQGMTMYHLSELSERDLAYKASVAGMGLEATWELTPAGRKLFVQRHRS